MNIDFPKISFITACKGRLHHLSETLPKNIFWNIDYPNLEFVLLDYNSPDGLDLWIMRHMTNMIEKGILVYFKNMDPDYFHYTHSRNMLIKLATGDIVCNLDADNYSGEDFAFYIADRIKKVDFLIASLYHNDNVTYNPLAAESFGRIAIKKEAILHAGGYFEKLEHWGSEDMDLYIRLKELGFCSETLPSKFLRSISHSDNERGAFSKIIKVGQNTKSHQQNIVTSQMNINNGNLIVNNGCFGQGIVYKNFSKNPIEVF